MDRTTAHTRGRWALPPGEVNLITGHLKSTTQSRHNRPLLNVPNSFVRHLSLSKDDCMERRKPTAQPPRWAILPSLEHRSKSSGTATHESLGADDFDTHCRFVQSGADTNMSTPSCTGPEFMRIPMQTISKTLTRGSIYP